ncbi:MAG: DUF4867 family protein [Dysgonamonadaceae bacterium]|jgi:hypothetical protein|nr:DUF4867 family protein [Dysgonamonadaceae bacterium]
MVPKQLQNKNPHITIKHVDDESFRRFGAVLTAYDFSAAVDYILQHTPIPEEGNLYVASSPELEKLDVMTQIENGFYGEMPIQAGYCNGRNATLNAMEYHRGSEIDVAVSDLVLLLGRLQDVDDGTYDSKNTEAFFMPAGTAVQLYETTLHFSPCTTTPDGFRCIIILPRGTNLPLRHEKSRYGDPYLFARNKWLMAHPERKQLLEKGAYAGIKGQNIEIKKD